MFVQRSDKMKFNCEKISKKGFCFSHSATMALKQTKNHNIQEQVTMFWKSQKSHNYVKSLTTNNQSNADPTLLAFCAEIAISHLKMKPVTSNNNYKQVKLTTTKCSQAADPNDR